VRRLEGPPVSLAHMHPPGFVRAESSLDREVSGNGDGNPVAD
jgi:hypothetical protein